MNNENVDQQNSILEPSDQAQKENTNTDIPSQNLVKYDIRTVEGSILSELDFLEIEQGLKEGWLTLDDEIHHTEDGSWSSIQRTFSNTNFSIKVSINPQIAYAESYGETLSVIFLLLSVLVGLFYYGLEELNLSAVQATGFTIGCLIVLAGLFKGNLILMIVGVGVVAMLGGGLPYHGRDQADLAVNSVIWLFKLGIGVVLVGAVGAAIGYITGYQAGLIYGFIRRDTYQPPIKRSPIPDCLKDRCQSALNAKSA